MLTQMNIKRQPVIQRGNLTIDPQCCTVILESENVSLSSNEATLPLIHSAVQLY